MRIKNKTKQNHIQSVVQISSPIRNDNVFLTTLSAYSNAVDSRPMLIFCAMLLPVVVLAFYPSSGGDYDIWFHLAYGRHYVENWTWSIDHSQFSWTPTIPDWKFVTWIGSGLLYLAHQAGGIPGVFMLQWFVYLLVFCSMVYFLRITKQHFDIWRIMGLLTMSVVHKLVGIYVKPELFTTLFFALAIGIYYSARVNNKYVKLIYIYPVLFFVWVNTHGGFLIGMFAMTFVWAIELALFFIKNSQSEVGLLRHLTLSMFLSYLAVLINPHGIYYHISTISYLLSTEYMGSANTLFAYLGLWQFILQNPLISPNFVLSAWGMLLLGISFACVSVFVWRQKRYVDYLSLTLNLFFFFFSMAAARSVIFYPIIWFFSINYIFWKCDLRSPSRYFNAVSLPLYCALSALIFYITFCMLDTKAWFGQNLENSWPEKEVSYIMKHKLPMPIFNDYIIGGYMIWTMYPDYKVWIDPRYGPYVKQALPDWNALNDYLSTPEKFAAFHKRYPFKTALIHIAYPNIITALMNMPEWRMVYFDKVAAVLIHVSVIPELSQDALDTSLNPDRYRELSNPTILSNLFAFYNNFGQHFAEEIRDIYARNVSDWYKFKNAQLMNMDQSLKKKWNKNP